MKINFFEEYPTEENMAKLQLVTWPTTALVAAQSLEEFESIRARYSSVYPNVTFGWWPTIPGSYWVSGFSNPKDLERLFAELTSKPHPDELSVLIDLELPLKFSLYVRNLFHLRRNKKRIAAFFADASNHGLKLYASEYPAPNAMTYYLWNFFGISPSFSFPHTKLPMVYTSMGRKSFGEKAVQKIKRWERSFAQTHPHRVGFGLGTIATGVLGNEPILSPEDLAEDLKWARETGVDEIFIFRLGGLNKEVLAVLDFA